MKKIFAAVGSLIFLAVLALGVANAQQATAGTGNKKFDAQLKALNDEAKTDPDGFLRRLSRHHNVPEEEIRQAKRDHHLDDADVYMATVLARRANRRVGDVAAEFEKNKGQGWGVMAQRMGIKPGSPEFKRMKAEAKGHTKHMKSLAKTRQRHEKDMEREKGRGQGKGKDKGPGKGKNK